MFKQTLLVVALALALGACQQQSAAPAAAPAAGDAKLANDLAAYRALRDKQSYELAASIGQDIVSRAPGSAAAAEVQQTLAEVSGKAQAAHATKRLAALWIYQTGVESGGAQSTASIYSSTPGSEAERVDLILRRHADWGNSAYLFGHPPGFECGESCEVQATFDDAEPIKLKAYSPETGEPALMIKDEAAFIDALAKAQKLQLEIVAKGKGPQTLVYEVGGYDASKFAPLPAKP